jgi:hypothetical protein
MATEAAAYLRAWKHAHPELRLVSDRRRDRLKIRARSAVGWAIRSGRLDRGPCQVCGTERTEAHHDDYARPLDVTWLCRPHHLDLHRSAA